MKNEKTKIGFNYNDKDYVLEYTAASLKRAERKGMNISKLADSICNAPEELFVNAFEANHPTVSIRERKAIYQELRLNMDDDPKYDENGKVRDELTEVLSAMISEAIDEISNRPGKLEWKKL